MKLVQRYVFREIAQPFVLGLAVFTFVLLMGKLLKLAEMVVANGVPLSQVGKLILFLLPSFMSVTIPMSLLLAVLLAFGRLSGDSEITAMKGCGISLNNLLPPVLAFGLIVYLLSSFMTVIAMPWGQSSMRALLYDIVSNTRELDLKEGVFNDQFPNITLFFERTDPATAEMRSVLIHDDRQPKEPVTIFAERGTISQNGADRTVRMILHDGSIHRNKGTQEYSLVKFGSYDLTVDLSPPPEKKFDEQALTLPELQEAVAAAPNKKVRRKLLLEYHRRFAVPAASFVFAVVAMPLGLQNRRSGKSGGFAVSITLLLLYYMLSSSFAGLAEKGGLPPMVAAWLPNALFLALGLYLLRKSVAEEEVALVAQPLRLMSLLVRRPLLNRGPQ